MMNPTAQLLSFGFVLISCFSTLSCADVCSFDSDCNSKTVVYWKVKVELAYIPASTRFICDMQRQGHHVLYVNEYIHCAPLCMLTYNMQLFLLILSVLPSIHHWSSRFLYYFSCISMTSLMRMQD